MSQETRTAAAAELADHYIEIILSTKPELLVPSVASAQIEDIPRFARKLFEYRQQLINGLVDQQLNESND